MHFRSAGFCFIFPRILLSEPKPHPRKKINGMTPHRLTRALYKPFFLVHALEASNPCDPCQRLTNSPVQTNSLRFAWSCHAETRKYVVLQRSPCVPHVQRHTHKHQTKRLARTQKTLLQGALRVRVRRTALVIQHQTKCMILPCSDLKCPHFPSGCQNSISPAPAIGGQAKPLLAHANTGQTI